jgi:hypothetical protein
MRCCDIRSQLFGVKNWGTSLVARPGQDALIVLAIVAVIGAWRI